MMCVCVEYNIKVVLSGKITFQMNSFFVYAYYISHPLLNTLLPIAEVGVNQAAQTN